MRFVIFNSIAILGAAAITLDSDSQAHGTSKGCMATYSWRQAYWTGNDTTFIDFFKTPQAKEYNCGDVYLNIADASNEGHLLSPERLADFLSQFREVSGNTATIYLFYAGGAPGYNDTVWALDFVRLFEEFTLNYIHPSLGPVGISFNVDLPLQAWMEIFDKTDEMKKTLHGYDVKVDVTFEDFKRAKPALVDKIMYRADHVNVITPSNNYDGLVELFEKFLTKTCPYCSTAKYDEYKAKITFIGEGDCRTKRNCKEGSMCAKFSACPSDPDGGILYAYDKLMHAIEYTSAKILLPYKFDHFFPADETHIGLNHFEWVRCFYGYQTWIEANLTECGSQYFGASQQCATQ
ncbi:hypothetical protein FOL47_010065 [Perkinsus chesapeaki]|uniref:Uncharacterized protein n=1 Tax=Perkinsus chesapeaki TaxID=330153 RepID=A0A7J6MQY8_PERCH|nr:hypothetical protein FOL47_010065 [Perkinsus chesapeaki]